VLLRFLCANQQENNRVRDERREFPERSPKRGDRAKAD
jgi:hypothetical protein